MTMNHSPMTPSAAIVASQKPRTKIWGVVNTTDETIEIAFGQLKSRYDLPDYTKDTGVKIVAQNVGKGEHVRDPLNDTGNKPIAASYYSFSVQIANGQVLNAIDEAPADHFMPEAIMVLTYANTLSGSRKLRLSIVTDVAEVERLLEDA